MLEKEGDSRRAQVTLFVILAVVLVLAIILFFSFRDVIFGTSVPRNMRPVYDAYTDCVETIATDGIYLLGQQGGYIEVPDFSPGSSYRPFSSHLDFFGQPVPYWMYVSGNNLVREQVPTKQNMQRELEAYIKDRLDTCSFRDYEAQGFGVYIEEGEVDVIINDDTVAIKAQNPVTLYFGNDSARVTQHDIDIDVRLGKLYDYAFELYNYEKTDVFLEKYALDVLRLYVPVDGVEVQCTPIVFNDLAIRENLTQGLVANINFLKVKGSYYDLQREEHEYFVIDPGFSVDTNVNIIYDPTWPTRVEIHGERIAQPVGVQEGMAALGFCYVPYHLVYDVNFPVLIQFWEGDFFFQFPFAVIIEKNYAREALPPMQGSEVSLDSPICQFRNQDMKIYTYDSMLAPLPARIQFECLDAACEIGESRVVAGTAVYEGVVPQCVNGFIVASAPGYADARVQISTNEQQFADIILPRKYTLGLDLGDIDGTAVVTFTGEQHHATVLYPEMKTIELIEDYYNVSVYVYQNTTLTIEGYSEETCVDTPVTGVGALFGLTQERCYDITIPEMPIEAALQGGGTTQDYITEDVLRRSRELNINVPLFYTPRTIEDIQNNYVLVEDTRVYISFE